MCCPATMKSSEEIQEILERYTRLKQKEIPKELEDYLVYVAKTGDTIFKWSSLKYLFREKLLNAIKNFNEDLSRLEEIPNYSNMDPFNYEAMKSSLIERLDLFNAAPFTVQRLCELLIEPRKQYTRIDKFMRALEKNIFVVSTVEPGRKRANGEIGDSLDSMVNGNLSLEVNIDIEVENEALYSNAYERTISGNAISPLKALHPRPNVNFVEPKVKKVKLSCVGKAKAREAAARRIAKANPPETPDEPDEEDDEINEPTPSYVKLSSECERIEKSNVSDKFNDEKLIEKQKIENCEKNNDKHDDLKNDNEAEAIESKQIASPSLERDVVDILKQADEEETKKALNSNINDNGDDQVEHKANTNAVCEKEKAETDKEIKETVTIKKTEGNIEEDIDSSTITQIQAPQTNASKEEKNAHEPVPIETDELPPTLAVVADEFAAAIAADELNKLLANICVDQMVTAEPPELVVNAISTDAAVVLPFSTDVVTITAVADQPMDEEQQVLPYAVEEIVMAQPMDEEQQVLPNEVEEIVMAELNKDEPAGMEVDDTSQEEMDQ